MIVLFIFHDFLHPNFVYTFSPKTKYRRAGISRIRVKKTEGELAIMQALLYGKRTQKWYATRRHPSQEDGRCSLDLWTVRLHTKTGVPLFLKIKN